MSRVTDVYRPVSDTSWVPDLQSYINDHELADRITLADPSTYLVRLIKRNELNGMNVPRSISLEYFMERLRSGLPGTFAQAATIASTGVSFPGRKEQAHTELIIKLAHNAMLDDENGALYERLAPYDVQPDLRVMQFYIPIGTVLLRGFRGADKLSARLGMSDALPGYVSLGAGVVLTSGWDAPGSSE